MGGIADAEQAWPVPLLQPVDLHGQQLHCLPIRQGCDAPGHEGRECGNAVLQCADAFRLQCRQTVLGYDIAALKIVAARDHDERTPGGNA